MRALHMAAAYAKDKIAKMLIDRGVKLTCKDKENGTPLHMACAEGSVKVVETLFEAAENLEDSVLVTKVS